MDALWVKVSFGIIVLIILVFIAIYNSLIRQRNDVNNAFSQIDVQLTRRHDLIPNLVEVAKKYMQHEQETLTSVIAARNHASDVLKNPGETGGLPDIAKLAGAEQLLGKNMGAFYATFENYPDLKADERVAELHEELNSTENRIAFARQHFNDNVTQYNTYSQTFPNNIAAKLFGFKAHQWLEFDDIEYKHQPIKVDFG
ncbi:LemA family protein [Suttonella sp. R2A3]|uniref:LemA family protein n=1 Tax=Suttonella sp. R2A3 TaxID=2908648 RepID=UPI0038FCEEFD